MTNKSTIYAAFWMLIAIISLVMYAMGADAEVFIVGAIIMSKLFLMEAGND